MSATRLATILLTGAALTSCTDRLAPSDDRYGRDGQLIAMSGGEGGARYACVTCHGVRGEGNGFDAPRLAGLPAGYLQKQMEDYADNLRPHEVMRDVAGFLDSDERVMVANYYSALPPAALPPATLRSASTGAEALYREGAPARGLASCASCHGEGGVGAAEGPPLAGQPAFYLARQLRDWQVARRRNDGGNVMLREAQKMTPAEIEAVSAYLAQLPPALPSLAR
jgi:cytochrome c553